MLNWYSGAKVCQENIPHTIRPPPPPAWTVDTRQDGSMLSCCLCDILTLPSESHSWNRDSSDQATFSQSSIVQFWWACANCSLSFLFSFYQGAGRRNSENVWFHIHRLWIISGEAGLSTTFKTQRNTFFLRFHLMCDLQINKAYSRLYR